jgi:hypothetical protein
MLLRVPAGVVTVCCTTVWINIREYRRGNRTWTIHRNWQHTRRRKTRQKDNTICSGHHYAQTNTNNVQKTWNPYKPLEAKTNRTSFYAEIAKNIITSQLRTKRHIIGQLRKLKRWATWTPSKNRGWTEWWKCVKRTVSLIISKTLHINTNFYSLV